MARLVRFRDDELRERTLRHPCYSPRAAAKFARIHLAVAPACNIQCRYCCRRFDCVNESRPGVASEVLDPEAALARFLAVREKMPELSVVGVAGPGEALANWPVVKETLEGVRAADPDITFCLATNGLLLADHADELSDLGLRHLTVTINAVDPGIGALIYKWVDYGGRRHQGLDAAKLLLDRQLEGLSKLAEREMVVKVNIVMLKGVNDEHIPEIVKTARRLKVLMTNIMPFIPALGSDFADRPPTSRRELEQMRLRCQPYLFQMSHCRQCRADAVGCLGHDRRLEFCGPDDRTFGGDRPSSGPYRLAVCSRHGLAVDTHFGHCERFLIYEGSAPKFVKIEERVVRRRYCDGVDECGPNGPERSEIVDYLSDCQAVVSTRIGWSARELLSRSGIAAFEDCGSIAEALDRACRSLADSGVAAAVGEVGEAGDQAGGAFGGEGLVRS